MSDRELCREIEKDLQGAAAGRGVVLYLEGKTDVPILLGLLGPGDEREVAGGSLRDGVLLRGLSGNGGSGSSAVKQRVAVAQRHGYRGIFGVLDGDGEALGTLAAEFDDPHPGPLFRWKCYCIENLLAQASWPERWQAAPDWPVVLATFAPYVAINRLWKDLQQRLKRLGLDRFRNPDRGRPLETSQDVLARLRAGQHELSTLEIAELFAREVDAFTTAVQTSVDEGHARVNGKWIVETFAARHMGLTHEQCRDEWITHLRSVGGYPEIKAWWRRTIAP